MTSNTRLYSLLRRSACLVAAACLLAPAAARADIFRFDNHRLIPGTTGITPGPGVDFSSLNLSRADLRGLDLTGCDFTDANIRSAYFRDSDLRGATGWRPVFGSSVQNTIRPDGTMKGLHLSAREVLTIRNDDIPITVTSSATAPKNSTLAFVLEDDWTSTVTLARSITPSLKCTLNLTVDPSADVDSLIGQSFDLFDWGKTVTVKNHFLAISSDEGFTWDASKLYTTGEVTLVDAPSAHAGLPVPEPASLAVLSLGVVALLARRKRA
jgi:hypothetical protein